MSCVLQGVSLFVILSGFLFIEKSMSEELKIHKAPEVSLIITAVMFLSLCIIPVYDLIPRVTQKYIVTKICSNNENLFGCHLPSIQDGRGYPFE